MGFKLICDRCNKDITDSIYYTIDVYAHDVDTSCGTSFAVAARNTLHNFKNVYGNKRCYCQKCTDDIESFMVNEPITE